jgi:putative oxidoreductase
MNYVQRIETWAEEHQAKWLALLRIVLGVTIFLKGLFFIMNTDALLAMISNSASDLWAVFLVHLVALTHLMGGLLIILGLITRFAVVLQIPILLGAIIFVNAQRGFYSGQSELILSIVVLALLIFFLIFGSGKFSVDEWMKVNKGNDH